MKAIKKVSVIMALIMIFGVAAPVSSVFNPAAAIKVSAAASKKPKLSKTKYTMAKKQTFTLKVTNTKKKVKWTAGNKKVKLKKSGKYGVKITAKKTGKVTVTAKVDGKTLKCKITIKKKLPAKNITITNYSLDVRKGGSVKLKYTVTPENTTDKITFTSSDKNILKVNGKGKITGVNYGGAYVTVKCGKKSDKTGVLVCKSASAAAKPENVTFTMPSSAVVDADKIEATVSNNGSQTARLYSPAIFMDMNSMLSADMSNETELLNSMAVDMYTVDESSGDKVYSKVTYLDIKPNTTVKIALASKNSAKLNYNPTVGVVYGFYFRYDTRYYIDMTSAVYGTNEHILEFAPPFDSVIYEYPDVLKA